MNNLLRKLAESQIKTNLPDSELRQLLTAVKDSRRSGLDAKLSDPFYDSLEGLLTDLRTVTIDNHDAEPFLKPVSRAEAPDYYDVIANPMDLGTMLKKVKQKQYKSKREFKDDLDLIWSNCYQYNAAENHPLRQCAKRLKVKADRLLKYITDRKERTDPPIPSDLAVTHIARPKINGHVLVNGRSHAHHRSPSLLSNYSKAGTPEIRPSSSIPSWNAGKRSNLPFADTPAIVRTPEGMAMFTRLDSDITNSFDSTTGTYTATKDTQSSIDKLHKLAAPILQQTPTEDEQDFADFSDSSAGEKRKANHLVDSRPRKRKRYSSQYATPIPFERDELSELWWGAVQSDALLANGLPHIPLSSSLPSSSSRTHSIGHPPDSKPRSKQKRKKKKERIVSDEPAPPKSLLTVINNNMKTMKRLRYTHARFSALNLSSNSNADDPEGGGGAEGMGFGGGGGGSGARGGTPTTVAGLEDDDALGIVDEKIDERPWPIPRKGKRKVGGIELGQKNAEDCVKWMTGKVLEHVGFQGSSKTTLDVFAGVASEYLLNVGMTIKFLSEKYANTMSPEEIILHTLFESGTSKIQDLERYIRDDVERYGARLSEVEKKLINAYPNAAEPLADEYFFEEEDGEDAGVLAMGDFAESLGEDYLGLRELGIAAEFGLSSLSIPKKLLKRKKGQNKPTAAKPTEPPPPYPPPPPLLPLESTRVDEQIGLLKPYYQGRFSALAAAQQAPSQPQLPPPLLGPSIPGLPTLTGPVLPPPLRGPTLPGPSISGLTQPPTIGVTPYGTSPYPPISIPASATPDIKSPTPAALMSEPPSAVPGASPLSATPVMPTTPIVLPDDPPNAAQVKMGPLGQILRGGGGGAAAKKKKAGSSGPGGAGTGGGSGGADVNGTSPAKKKKTGMVGVGSGSGRKKKSDLTGEGGGVLAGVMGHGVPTSFIPAFVPMPVVSAAPVQQYEFDLGGVRS